MFDGRPCKRTPRDEGCPHVPLYKKLSILEKYEVVRKLEEGASVSRLSAEYNVHATTIRRIRRNKTTLCHTVKQGDHMSRRKVLRLPVNAELDSRLQNWFLARNPDEPITNSVLMEKAMEINREIGGPSDFKASVGWLQKFKYRHGIVLGAREKVDPDVDGAQRFVESFVRRVEEEERIRHDNIYNMAATRLIWKTFPTKTPLGSEERRIEDLRLKKDRVTVGLCANVTGNHKLAPLFVHKYETLATSTEGKDGLTVVFQSQPKPWIEQGLFLAWYNNYFKPFVKQHQLQSCGFGKVVLIVDSDQGRMIPKEFHKDENFEILSLPDNTGPLLQPMEQGVIQKTKMIFRQKMLQQVYTAANGQQMFNVNYTINDCMNMLHEAWSAITVSDVYNSWKKILKSLPEEVMVKEEPWDPLQPTVRDVIGMINGQEATEDDVNEFLSRCTDAENDVSEDEGDMEDTEGRPRSSSSMSTSSSGSSTSTSSSFSSISSSISGSPPSKTQMKEIIKSLKRWCKKEPVHIHIFVDSLYAYCKNKYRHG